MFASIYSTIDLALVSCNYGKMAHIIKEFLLEVCIDQEKLACEWKWATIVTKITTTRE